MRRINATSQPAHQVQAVPNDESHQYTAAYAHIIPPPVLFFFNPWFGFFLRQPQGSGSGFAYAALKTNKITNI